MSQVVTASMKTKKKCVLLQLKLQLGGKWAFDDDLKKKKKNQWCYEITSASPLEQPKGASL